MMKSYENSLINSLLISLPAQEISQIVPLLKPVPLIARQVIFSIGDHMSSIYFPCGGLVSKNVILPDGSGLEIMAIGREGAFGIAGLFGPEISAHEVTVQITGTAWLIPTIALKRILVACPVLTDQLSHLFSSWVLQVAQVAACTGRHNVVQRCASKLLNASEKSGNNTLPLTHENIAAALGVRRAGITNAIAGFERAGLIQSIRGSIEILDRKELWMAACKCNAY